MRAADLDHMLYTVLLIKSPVESPVSAETEAAEQTEVCV